MNLARIPQPISPQRSLAPASSAANVRARDWFLLDSHWNDVQWVLAPTSALHEDRPVVIRWAFTLPNGRLFTRRQYAALLESAREHLSLIRVGFGRSRTGCAGSSLRLYFQCMRALIRWMIQEGLQRFADLDAELVADFTRAVSQRRGRTRSTISRETLSHYYRVLTGLYQHRGTVRDTLQIDPFPGLSVRAATPGSDEGNPESYTPDVVAIPLIQGAIELLNATAFRTLALRESCLQTYQRLRAAKVDRRTARLAVLSALYEITIDTPLGPYRFDSHRSLSSLIDLLYGACFVVISYLVGPRVSEILRLQAGCVQPFDKPGSDVSLSIAAIVGAIYKAESYHGRRHQWIAPPPAIHAITVLEALSEPHRARSGRADLWQRPRIRDLGIDEWLPDSTMTLRVSDTRSANERVNRFVKWLGVPRYKGRRWKFSSHQGRKTFARFVALRDRTALYALAQHLGHRDVRQTDQAYVGTDYQLHHEIETEVLDQSISAWELMLSARTLGGRMGAEVLARRPRFRGSRVKQEIRAYARMLAETGLTLGVCEWGYCVYREEVSACHGSPTAPDPVRREPSTCARCKNFSLTDAHRPYWIEQVDRYQRILNDPALPTQTLKIARTRLDEARALIRSMDSPPKEVRRARTVPQ
jgi:integrase